MWYSQLPVHGSFASDLLPGYLLVGVGLPLGFVPVSIAALAGVREHEAGLASGLINTSQQIGGAIGVAVASTVFTSHASSLLRHGTAPAIALTKGFTLAFWVLAGIAVAGAIAAVTFVRREELVREPEAEAAAAVTL